MISRKLGVLIILYIDDFFITAVIIKIINIIKNNLEKYFKFKQLGEVRTFLGFDIVRDRKERIVFIL